MGLHAIEALLERQRVAGGDVLFCALQPSVRQMFSRAGLLKHIGEQRIFWGADQAIMAAHQARLTEGCAVCAESGCELLQTARQHLPYLSPAEAAKPVPEASPPQG
jgi:hypothetical protein